jgi:hypothetical protein
MNDQGFRESDAHELNLLEAYEADYQVKERFVMQSRRGSFVKTITFPRSDSPLASVAGRHLFSKTMTVSALVDEEVSNFSVYYAKSMRQVIDWAFKAYALTRMQFFVRSDQVWGKRWAKFLGFEYEGTLKSYGEELFDHDLFARVI